MWEYSHKKRQIVTREEAEALLHRLQALKSKVAVLRRQCEELKKQGLEEHSTVGQVCSECGNSIESGQEVSVKASDGTVRTCYHQECFRQLLQ